MTNPPDRLAEALKDRYTLERELGRGGMATVYLATDLKHERPVALKVLRPELAAALGPDRFLREIRLTAALDHPHILALLDSGTADGQLFYVMPYVEGETLRDRLERERQLPLDDALQIAREVADALGYAHSRGIVHRDIKPENVLLSGGHARVADFGIAKAVSAAGSERLTETGLAVGTPAYMSPEQAAGNPDLDGRSDLYSLGCVLYEMLAGDPPFYASTPQAVLAKKLSESVPRVSVVRETVPPGLETVLTRMLARTPADRYATAAQFAEALSHREAAVPGPRFPAPPWWRRRAVRLAVVGAVVAVLVTVGGLRLRDGAGGRYPRTAIAVLPFENLSGPGPNAYFAGGLHDELLTQLTKVAALHVIGRTSVMGYAGTTKRLSEIGDELAVGSLVEGSVQVIGDRLRVNVQLIDPTTEGHLWAERFDRTLDDAFAVQSDIALQIVAAVGAALGGAERTAIAAAPTANPEAYRLYLQGLEYFRRPGYLRRNHETAQQLFERAVALDSTFALAYAALSMVHARFRSFRWDPSPGRLARRRETAETALRLAPGLPQAHAAMAPLRESADARLREYEIALAGQPNDAELWLMIGFHHRARGHWREALSALDRVVALDPRNADAAWDLGAGTFRVLHRYQEALAWHRRGQALAPDLLGDPGGIWLEWQGRLDSLRSALSRLPPETRVGPGAGRTFERARLLLYERNADSLLALLGQTADPVFAGQVQYTPTALYAAWAHELRGDNAAAHAAFESARVHLDSVLTTLPDDWRVHAARGLALAGLGRSQEARREAQWLEASPAYQNDVFSHLKAARARVLARIGNTDDALPEIERLLAGPSWFSVHILRLDPLFDPIRDDPRLQALLKKYDPPRPVPLN